MADITIGDYSREQNELIQQLSGWIEFSLDHIEKDSKGTFIKVHLESCLRDVAKYNENYADWINKKRGEHNVF